VAITSSPEWLYQLYEKWRAAAWEKFSVLVFLAVGALSLLGFVFPFEQAGWIPLLNILVAVKVAIGSWGAVLVFIRYRGLL
jgi:multicomponent Na+:H+ antiporter subunit B